MFGVDFFFGKKNLFRENALSIILSNSLTLITDIRHTKIIKLLP